MLLHIPSSCILLLYDINVYIKLCKNFDKYKYHIIYNGSTHTQIFNEFMMFLKIYNYKFN